MQEIAVKRSNKFILEAREGQWTWTARYIKHPLVFIIYNTFNSK